MMFWSRRQSVGEQYVRFIYMKKTFVLLSFLKKRARQLKKDKSIKWCQAIDEAAKELGYANYKNYKNISYSDFKKYKFTREILLDKISRETNISKKLELAYLFIQNHGTPFRDSLDILKQFQHSKEMIQVVCENLNLMKDEIQCYLLQSFLSKEGETEINMFYENYIAKQIAMSNLLYEIDEDMLCIAGNYSLRIEFSSEVPRHLKKLPHFQNHELSGSFDITIDRNKKITLEECDIGDSNEFRGGPFTEEEMEDYYKHFPNERGRFDDMLVLNDSNYDHLRQCLIDKKPLTGKTLELALDLVDVYGDDEQSQFIRNIGMKLKEGQLLGEYEQHILVDVLMFYAQLGS